MAKLIDADALRVCIMGEPPDAHYPSYYADLVDKAPTLDVQPVRRGEWEKEPYLFGWTHRCNRCGENFGMPHGMFNFCPHCGADMRKVSERDQFAGMGGYGGR